jgi:hypothetical protein
MIRALNNLGASGVSNFPLFSHKSSSGETMKNIKHFCVVFTLLLTLSISVWAGEMPGAGITAAPSPSISADGEMPGAGVTAPVIEIVLKIAESILSTP